MSPGALVLLCGVLKRVGDSFGLIGDKRVYVDAGCGIVVSAYIPCDGIVENGKRLLGRLG